MPAAHIYLRTLPCWSCDSTPDASTRGAHGAYHQRMETLEYQGCTATVTYDAQTEVFLARSAALGAGVECLSDTEEGIAEAFRAAVNDKMQGLPPKCVWVLNIPTELQRAIDDAAERAGVPADTWVEN